MARTVADNNHMRLPAANLCATLKHTRLIAMLSGACILLAMAQTSSTEAAIFACQSDNTVVFQDRPCPLEKVAAKTQLKTNVSYPLDIHESWFKTPEHAADRAFCDKHGCECGNLVRQHSGSLELAVADALYLDGSWHRYESSYRRWSETPASSQQIHAHRVQMMEASCEIMMAQTLLQNFSREVLLRLKKRLRDAEERGFDIEEPCVQGIDMACELYSSVKIYRQLTRDATALKNARQTTPVLGYATPHRGALSDTPSTTSPKGQR